MRFDCRQLPDHSASTLLYISTTGRRRTYKTVGHHPGKRPCQVAKLSPGQHDYFPNEIPVWEMSTTSRKCQSVDLDEVRGWIPNAVVCYRPMTKVDKASNSVALGRGYCNTVYMFRPVRVSVEAQGPQLNVDQASSQPESEKKGSRMDGGFHKGSYMNPTDVSMLSMQSTEWRRRS